MSPKNSKKIKTPKNGTSLETEYGGAEILCVVPPQLLQKFGLNIAIANLNNEDGSDSTTKPNTSSTFITNDQNKLSEITYSPAKVAQETSFLRTASLMKESVLLSPSFTQNLVDSPKQVESSARGFNDLRPLSILKENVDAHLSDADTKTNINCKNKSSIHLSKKNKKAAEVSSLKISEQVPDITKKDKVGFKKVQDCAADIEIIQKNAVTEDNSYNTYIVDCSNNNFKCSENASVLSNGKSLSPRINTKLKNKISILSEEMIIPSQFKELKSMHSYISKVSDHPMSLKSALTKTIFHGNVDENNDNNILANDKGRSLRTFDANRNETTENIYYKLPNSETIVIYDDKGHVIDTVNCNSNSDGVDKESYETNTIAPSDNPSSLDVCIDFNVSDIEKHLEDNVEILEDFVYEITDGDSNKIIETIESSENLSSEVSESISKSSLEDYIVYTGVRGERPANEFKIYSDNAALTEYSMSQVYDLSRKNCESSKTDLLNSIDPVKCTQCDNIAENITLTKAVNSLKNHEDKISKGSEHSAIDDYDMRVELNVLANSDKHQISDPSITDLNNLHELGDFYPPVNNHTEANKIIDTFNLTERRNVCETLKDSDVVLERGPLDLKSDESSRNGQSLKCQLKSDKVVFEIPELTNKEKRIEYVKGKANKGEAKKINDIAISLRESFGHRTYSRRRSDVKVESPIICQKKNLSTTKSHIQGVEKPGGLNKVYDESNNRTLKPKIYTMKSKKAPMPTRETGENTEGPEFVDRNNIIVKTYPGSKSKKTHTPTDKISVANEIDKVASMAGITTYSVENSNIDIEVHMPRNNQFCICKDFGSFEYYDDERLYEHVHFMEHKKIDCDTQSLFSMYHESNFSRDEKNIDANVVQDTSAIDEFGICYNTWKNSETNTNRSSMIDIAFRQSISDNHEDLIQTSTDIIRKKINVTDKPLNRRDTKTDEQEKFGANKTNLEWNQEGKNKSEEQVFFIPENYTPSKLEIKLNRNETKDLLANSKTLEANINHSCMGNDSKKEDIKHKLDQFSNKKIEVKKEDIEHKLDQFSNKKIKIKKEDIEHKLDQFSNKKIEVKKEDIEHKLDQFSNKKNENYMSKEISEKNKKSADITHPSDANTSDVLVAEDCGVDQDISGINATEETSENLMDIQVSEENKESNAAVFSQTSLVLPTVEKDDGINKIYSTAGQEVEETPKVPQTRERKRKNSTTEIYKQDNIYTRDEPPIKKSVKCGVCEELLVDVEWGKHCDDHHCFIAWKAGETIDLKNIQLVEKLRIRAKSSDLKCPFCHFENNKVRKFLRHVTECMKVAKPLRNNRRAKRRKSSSEETLAKIKSDLVEANFVKCGVCHKNVQDPHWLDHTQSHDYLAWKEGDPSLDLNDDKTVRKHLTNILKQTERLLCSNCDNSFKNVTRYLRHINKCKENLSYSDNTKQSQGSVGVCTDGETSKQVLSVTCAICSSNMEESMWDDHITVHNYLAWKEGDQPLDLSDEEMVKQFLSKVLEQTGLLVCSKCGYVRKNVKFYYNHIRKCDSEMGADTKKKIWLEHSQSEISTTDQSLIMDTTCYSNKDDSSLLKESFSTSSNIDINFSIVRNAIVKCGVCKEEVRSEDWLKHIKINHEYLAWKEGEAMLDVQNRKEVYGHLRGIVKCTGGLECCKCGRVKKTVKAFLQHVDNCKSVDHVQQSDQDQGTVTCAVCFKKIPNENWQIHRLKEHYNIAWIVGETPLDLNSSSVADRLLKEYKNHYKMTCKICKITRVSCVGFYAHILVCGKTDEETEQFKSTCNICNKKYLKIYHNQHMTAHRESENARERRQKQAERVETESMKQVESNVIVSGRRQAAVKAQSVIEQYKEVIRNTFTCTSCGFEGETKDDLEKHKCGDANTFSDSDQSVRIENAEESSESDVDSTVSDEEADEYRKRKTSKPVVHKLPFQVRDKRKYLSENCKEYCNFHFTDEHLFPDLYNLQLYPVPDSEVSKYLPILEESCKVKHDHDWDVYKRFEGYSISKGYSLFTGASIRSISWAPTRSDEDDSDHILAINCYNGTDAPRLGVDETVTGPGLIQFWNFGTFKSIPKFAFGLAHDYGTVWAMDWCPSGANDGLSATNPRLGLLAIACSNGSAYVFSIPHPFKADIKGSFIYKLEPVLELRLSMLTDKQNHQASSLSWCQQKGHAVIVVGYTDGTTAYYDLLNESPLLRVKGKTTVIYPYQDEKALNCTIMGLATYPSTDQRAPTGVVCTVGATGCDMVSRVSASTVRLRARNPASDLAFVPLWPAALYAGDDIILQWWGGGGRRAPNAMAGARCAGCARCGKLAVFAAPLLRAANTHPIYPEVTRVTIGSLQMIPLSEKPKKTVTDDLSVPIEPIKYEDVIEKYAVELKLDSKLKAKANVIADIHPNRFPLADVTSMAFCPSEKFHTKLAVATHCGVVFLLTVT